MRKLKFNSTYTQISNASQNSDGRMTSRFSPGAGQRGSVLKINFSSSWIYTNIINYTIQEISLKHIHNRQERHKCFGLDQTPFRPHIRHKLIH